MIDDCFSEIAPRYRRLRTTDPEPVRRILDHLPATPSRGADVGCGTGRYTQLLHDLLPAGSMIVAADANLQMLRVLRQLQAPGQVIRPVEAPAEMLPLRERSLDWITTFNAVHHFDLAAFLRGAIVALRSRGKLFIYTRTPEQNARSIWGRLFPGFLEKETRLRPERVLREAIAGTQGLALEAVEHFTFQRTSTPERLREQAQHGHYSTFWLYTKREIEQAMDTFLRSLPRPTVTWTDENLLVVCARRP